jgi:hypothetical protein
MRNYVESRLVILIAHLTFLLNRVSVYSDYQVPAGDSCTLSIDTIKKGVRMKINSHARLLGLLTVLPLCCTINNLLPEQTAATSGAIAGKVLQAQSGATVYLEQGRPLDSVSIDPGDGFFSLDSIPEGTYRLRIAAVGFDTITTSLTIEPGKSYNIGYLVLVKRTAAFNDTVPSVNDHYPKDKAELIYLPPDEYNQGSQRLYISVSFDRPMNRESVEKALTIDPPLDGGYFEWFQNSRTFNTAQSNVTWTGSAYTETTFKILASTVVAYDAVQPPSLPPAQITTYSIAKSFTFYFPRSGCRTDTTYTIKISRSAVDTAGTPLDTALEFSFSTVQSATALTGIEMLPHNGDDWVDLLAPTGIQLTFPRRMNRTSTEAHLHINVVRDPVFLWTDYNHLTVYTGGIFIPDTTYAISVDSATLDLDSVPLGRTERLSFRTGPLRVTASSPQLGALGVYTNSRVVLTFNTYVDRTSFPAIASLVSRSGDTVGCVVNNNWSCARYATCYPSCTDCIDTSFNLKQMLLTPVTELKHNMLYTLHLKPGAKDLGGFTMKNDYALQFITMP